MNFSGGVPFELAAGSHSDGRACGSGLAPPTTNDKGECLPLAILGCARARPRLLLVPLTLKRTQKMLATCNLRFHKIASNCREVMKAFPTEDYVRGLNDLGLDVDPTPIQCWDPQRYAFTFRVANTEKPFTRRAVEIAELATIELEFLPAAVEFYTDSRVVLGYISLLNTTTLLTGPAFLSQAGDSPSLDEESFALIDPDSDAEVHSHATTVSTDGSHLGSHRFDRSSSSTGTRSGSLRQDCEGKAEAPMLTGAWDKGRKKVQPLQRLKT
ncbi:hypothetical protein JZ751_027445 [Albula glossodonta]|uniref:Uncharacterized protein n=1 Tax=Albula glossodonta TaxID=121402 RepID=A0A8T2NG89_9TELE|nr:hypothetical protein JZ751_027445 [Albula glossodonta]